MFKIGRASTAPIFLKRLRRLTWYERVKTGPSPEDDSLLQVTRELSAQLGSLQWYKQIAWGRFRRGGTSWVITKPLISRELIGPIPQTELMLPEHLKGKLSLDEWQVLIAMHLSRVKAYQSGRMSKALGLMGLAMLAGIAILIVFLPVMIGRAWARILTLPAWALWILPILVWIRGYLRGWEFELDKNVADRFGTDRTLQILEKMKGIEGETRPPTKTLLQRFVNYWSPSVSDRMVKLTNPQSVALPSNQKD